jgi:PAS domain S-box-containing protein
MVSYAFEMWSMELAAKVFWKKMKYFGIMTAPTLWFIYTLHYSGYEKWLTRRFYAILSVFPLITLLLVFTNDTHRLIWANLTFVRGEEFSQLSDTYGIWLWALVIYSYLLILGGCLIFVKIYLSQRRFFQRYIVIVMIAAVALVVANIFEQLGLSPFPNLDLEPFVFGFAILVIALAYFRWGLGDITPLAYKAIMESMSDGVIVVDLQARILEINPAAQELAGIRDASVKGRRINHVLPGWPEEIKPPFIGAAWFKEFGIKRNDQERIIDLHISDLMGNDEYLIGYVMVLHDMTEIKAAEDVLRKAHDHLEKMVQKRTEQLQGVNEQLKQEIEERKLIEKALNLSEQRYALATRAAKVGVWDLNMQSNDFYLDPNIKAILGYSDAEIPNDLEIWANYIHPDDKQSVMDAFQTHIEKKTPEFFYEHRMLHKDGSVRWIRARGKAIWDTNGKPVRVVGTDVDITERIEAETAEIRQNT